VLAENYAVQNGLGVMIPSDEGVPGVVIGGAISKAQQSNTPAAQVYLQIQRAAQAALDGAKPAPSGSSPTLAPSAATQPAALSIAAVILIAVLGIAAIAAVAYVSAKNIAVDADKLVQLKMWTDATDASMRGDGRLLGALMSGGFAQRGPGAERKDAGFNWGFVAAGAGALALLWALTRKAA
jgi:hypothetical protein